MPDAGSTGITERANEIEALVGRCREGDLCAFTTLFERFQDRLYDLACAILHDGAEAEDAVQDTFLRAFERIKRFRGEGADKRYGFSGYYEEATLHWIVGLRGGGLWDTAADPPRPRFDDLAGAGGASFIHIRNC